MAYKFMFERPLAFEINIWYSITGGNRGKQCQLEETTKGSVFPSGSFGMKSAGSSGGSGSVGRGSIRCFLHHLSGWKLSQVSP